MVFACSCHFSVHYQVYKVDWAQMLTLIAECIKNPKKQRPKVKMMRKDRGSKE